MIRWSRVRSVAGFEFRNVALRPSYLITTFGLPLFFSLLAGGLIAVQTTYLNEQTAKVTVFGVIDEFDVLQSLDPWRGYDELDSEAKKIVDGGGFSQERDYIYISNIVLQRVGNEEEGKQLVADRKLSTVFLIEKDYLSSGAVSSFEDAQTPFSALRRGVVEPSLRTLLIRSLLIQHAPDEVVTRATSPMRIKRVLVNDRGSVASGNDRDVQAVVQTLVPFLLGALLLTALLSASGYLVQAIVMDKESKVVEILLSSLSADEILTGKLVGLGGAGILQFLVWSVMVMSTAFVATVSHSEVSHNLPWAAAAISPLFFLLGYLFIGSLMLTTGSIGTNAAESQKLTLGWAILAMIPLMVILVLLEEPHGPLAQVMTFIPFSAPLTVIVRMSVDASGIAWWEIALSLLVLLLSTYLSIRIGGRLFRIGLLLGSSRPNWRELWRQAS